MAPGRRAVPRYHSTLHIVECLINHGSARCNPAVGSCASELPTVSRTSAHPCCVRACVHLFIDLPSNIDSSSWLRIYEVGKKTSPTILIRFVDVTLDQRLSEEDNASEQEFTISSTFLLSSSLFPLPFFIFFFSRLHSPFLAHKSV